MNNLIETMNELRRMNPNLPLFPVTDDRFKPYGRVLMCYEIEYMDQTGTYAGEWQLESSHPSYQAAKEYLGWK